MREWIRGTEGRDRWDFWGIWDGIFSLGGWDGFPGFPSFPKTSLEHPGTVEFPSPWNWMSFQILSNPKPFWDSINAHLEVKCSWAGAALE